MRRETNGPDDGVLSNTTSIVLATIRRELCLVIEIHILLTL